jgi:hypothetical protein
MSVLPGRSRGLHQQRSAVAAAERDRLRADQRRARTLVRPATQAVTDRRATR